VSVKRELLGLAMLHPRKALVVGVVPPLLIICVQASLLGHPRMRRGGFNIHLQFAGKQAGRAVFREPAGHFPLR
jgi:hypothetical protein